LLIDHTTVEEMKLLHKQLTESDFYTGADPEGTVGGRGWGG